MQEILIALAISLTIQVVFFTLAYLGKTDRYTDLSYGSTFIIISIYLLLKIADTNMRQVLVASAVILWGTRLSGYLFIRIFKIKKDIRFNNIRNDFYKFAKFWLLQGISVWLVMLSTILAFQTNSNNISILNIMGLVIWLLGILIETVSDSQKFKFINRNPGKWVNTGLWKYSRHPNYFGEMLCWWGLLIAVFNSETDIQLIGLISPIYITALLLFVSGIPPLEKKMDEKYKGNKDYQRYKDETSLLIPLPTRKG
ncbi:MAG: DUF1295 domain-containing protein [Patescibacteria group bacterium]